MRSKKEEPDSPQKTKLTAIKSHCKNKRASGGTLVNSYPGKVLWVAGRGLRENRGCRRD